MLEKPTEHTDDPDSLRQSHHAGTQRTHAPHDQPDVHARLRRAIQGRDDLGIGEPVELGANPRGAARPRVCRFPIDQLDQAVREIGG